MRRLLTLILFTTLLAGCQQSSWTGLLKKESRLFTENEKVMVADTAAAIGFGYGYDPDLEIDYVFKTRELSDSEIDAKSGEMGKILKKYDTGIVIRFYEKAYQMKETQVWKMDYALERKHWHDYTFIQKYTLPDMERYFDILDKHVVQSDTAYASKLQQRKAKIKKSLRERLRKEQEERDELSRSKNRLFH